MLAEMKIEETEPSDYVMTVISNALDAAVYTLVLVVAQSLLGV